ncbi:hypothetical protein CVT26_012229 [Gymnopilus dilepis]|uniref:Ribonuclease H1 N-terminal domain-containing protein n=1 Tax=Gymnopilus dilepis TaxID=231916 RepID=A0A409YQ61_9AGAR|nr:hypothetical protein CVT26_012229 [Gymnopilus dilepis]
MDSTSSKLPTSPSIPDGGLASCLRQLGSSLRDVHSAIDKLNGILDRDTRATDALKAVNEILSDAIDGSTTHPGSSDTDEPVLVDAPIRPPSDDMRWYAVIVGREPGVFYSTGAQINANVHAIPNSRPVRFHSREEAQAAFDKALNAGEVEKVELILNRTTLTRKDFE